MKKIIICSLLTLLILPAATYGQKMGVKTNMLYWATSTPNLGLEVALSNKVTLSVAGGWNPFDLRSKTYEDGSTVKSKVKHWAVMPELKYWNCQSFQRSFWGIHGIVGHFNMADIPFVQPLKDYRLQGDAYGGGISYGYQWAMGKRWGLEASVGVGYLHLDYKKYEKEQCGEFLGDFTHDYVGPTKVGLSFIYYLK